MRLPISRLAATALLSLTGALLVPTAAHAANIVTNPGFESGLSGWSCSNGQAVAGPAHSGSYALQATPAGADYARCSQTISVKPNTAYTLSAWVKGPYVYLGVDGGGSTWSSGTDWNKLTTTFTTGASATSTTVYLHGWYGQGPYNADDVVLDGPGGTPPPQDTTPPTVPGALTVGRPTSSSLALSWSASTDDVGVDHYEVSRDGGTASNVGNVTGYTASGLSADTTYRFKVRACDAAGNCSAYTSEASGTTTGGTTPPPTGLPKHILTGYWQNFDNGATVQRLRDVQDAYDIIEVSFADADRSKPGGVTFTLDPALSSRLGGYTDADFRADIRTKQAAGKKVVLSVGGQNGTISVGDPTAAANFADSAYRLMQTYGFDGVDIDLENGISPTYMAQALHSLQSKAGAGFVLTMAPETLYMQSVGSTYLDLALRVKDILTVVNTQYYNSGAMNGCDGKAYGQGTVDFITAQACIALRAGLRGDQIGIGVPASPRAAGSGYVPASVVNNAIDCLAKGTNCGSFKPGTTWPDLRGAMTWSTNWDASNGNDFSTNVGAHVHSLP
ncbi:chitinase [Sphaerisporangium fuscum]|uniref:chitinase n=1 Tax=Sphaerisporangium fuscum TaxID=2835868 RepID=UPI001BDC9E5F|nr:glycoside hydrolase family 18 protein [Sphaerisporangium fuscum]